MYYADPPAAPPPPPPPPGGMPPPGMPPGGMPPPGMPPGAPPAPPEGLAPVLLAFPGPEPQSRGIVAIRIVLAIPHLIVLYALGVAAQIVTIIGWFAALFTGRLPDFAAEFDSGYLRWQTRVYAYILLLTDVYPPFALTDVPYPVRIATLPGRLNRLAVLFRFILIIPAGFVLAVISYGAFTVVLFVTWLIVLINGRMPVALHQALAAALRYNARVTGYILMLTSAYPGGLFGDQPAVPVYDQAFPPAPGPAFPPPPDPWRLVLSSAARKLVVWFLVIGAVLIAGVTVVAVIAVSNAANTVSAANAFNQMQAAANVLNNAEKNAASQTQACGQNNLTCVTKIDTQMANVYHQFAATMASISMPSSQDTAAAATILTDADQVATVYTQLGQATSAAQYVSIADSSDAQAEISKLRTDFDNLQSSLAGE